MSSGPCDGPTGATRRLFVAFLDLPSVRAFVCTPTLDELEQARALVADRPSASVAEFRDLVAMDCGVGAMFWHLLGDEPDDMTERYVRALSAAGVIAWATFDRPNGPDLRGKLRGHLARAGSATLLICRRRDDLVTIMACGPEDHEALVTAWARADLLRDPDVAADLVVDVREAYRIDWERHRVH